MFLVFVVLGHAFFFDSPSLALKFVALLSYVSKLLSHAVNLLAKLSISSLCLVQPDSFLVTVALVRLDFNITLLVSQLRRFNLLNDGVAFI